jgi:hypothetical protein
LLEELGDVLGCYCRDASPTVKRATVATTWRNLRAQDGEQIPLGSVDSSIQATYMEQKRYF